MQQEPAPLRRTLALLAAAAALTLVAGCTPAGPDTSAELVYRVRTTDGEAPGKDALATVRKRLDARVAEFGVERRDVALLGDGRVRIVLPERLAPRMDEVRAFLEATPGLDAALEETTLSGQ